MDLSNKVVAITGAGGVLMREFAFAMAECGARVALLDINEQAAKEVAAKIGKNALAIKTNCLDKQSIIAAKKEINEKWGSVNFLVNGAGGNNPKATCDNEYMTPDLPEETKSFFDLDESGLKFVFDLNISRDKQLYAMACGAFRALRYPRKRNRARLFRDQSEQKPSVR